MTCKELLVLSNVTCKIMKRRVSIVLHDTLDEGRAPQHGRAAGAAIAPEPRLLLCLGTLVDQHLRVQRSAET